jgi:hypothetical protein
MDSLKNALRQRDFGERFDAVAYAVHKKRWPNRRARLRRKWEKATGETWPKREITFYNRRLQRYDTRLVSVDAHHIIPQKNGGPHEWWNIVPVAEGHQGIIHGADSALSRMQGIVADR